jgi:hypothetical protein
MRHDRGGGGRIDSRMRATLTGLAGRPRKDEQHQADGPALPSTWRTSIVEERPASGSRASESRRRHPSVYAPSPASSTAAPKFVPGFSGVPPGAEGSLFPPTEASVARRKLISADGSFRGPMEAYFRRWKLPWPDGSLIPPMEASVARRKLISDGAGFRGPTEAYFCRRKLPWPEGSLFLPMEASVAQWKLISADGSFRGPMEAYFDRRKLHSGTVNGSQPGEAQGRTGLRSSQQARLRSEALRGLAFQVAGASETRNELRGRGTSLSPKILRGSDVLPLCSVDHSTCVKFIKAL